MGTAGPIGLAAKGENNLIDNNEHGFFFVLNSDIVCHFEFEKMIEKHR